jgi:cAMP-binding proteins - catabolite gene activator and regulatory subunit of cAMP-dependent protein kinases
VYLNISEGVILHLRKQINMEQIHDSGKRCLSILSSDENEELYSKSNSLNFEAGELIIKKGTPVNNIYFLKSGIVELSLNEAPHRQILNLLFDGEFIGINCVFSTAQYRFSARALTNCSIELLDKETFTKLLKANSTLSMAFIQYISWVNEGFLNWQMKLKEKNSAGALAFLISEFQKNFDSNSFEIPLTRQEMARIIGFSKESVLKNLADFRKEGLIDSNGKSITIIDASRLEEIAKYG